MQSKNILVKNLIRYMGELKYEDYTSFAKFLGVNVNTLKCWLSEKRTPNLHSIDQIANIMNLPAYYLLIPDVTFTCETSEKEKYIPNNSREIFSENLKQIYRKNNKFTWNEKAAIFYGYFSVDTLMSYTREKSHRTPPLSKIYLIAECLGMEPYKLIKKGNEV
jgi:transcriptional regulator with XRE-family HTH domain